jgi:hypothetical protein
MKPKKKPKAARKPEPIRDHGEIVTAPAGTTEEQVLDRLTGADNLPPIGQELGRAPSAPQFDPHAGHEVAPGREFGGDPEAMITTMVFIGIDRGGDFEDQVNELVTQAEKLGLLYITATISHMDLNKHMDNVGSVVEEVTPEPTIDTDDEPLDGNDDDYGEPI